MSVTKFKPVNARPVKRFFVEMLTRDIALEDAILDLLDNCVDGVLRSESVGENEKVPYSGFGAKITFDGNHFAIEDNCGGIPWDLHDQAFRMGRPPEEEDDAEASALTVGVYGIGMKRAIFKMGRAAVIWTQNGKQNYEVTIPDEWMGKEEEWDLPVKAAKSRMDKDGTRITVRALEKGIREKFTAESFQDELLDKIQSHYAIILTKGFRVEVNGTAAIPKPLLFKFAATANGEVVRPYVFRSEEGGIEVFVAVGLREPIPDADRTLDEQQETSYSIDYAGWTVICNDRVVLYSNKDELTGWGSAKIPRYHNQFRAINGVVEFRGDPRKLPTTTTKRGLEFSSPLYQRVLDRMREGLRQFIDFTNWWKAREAEAKTHIDSAKSLSFQELKRAAAKLTYAKVKTGLQGEQFRPKLPRPADDSPDVRISYFQERSQVAELLEVLVPDFAELGEKSARKEVGIRSFEYAYEHLVNGHSKKHRK